MLRDQDLKRVAIDSMFSETLKTLASSHFLRHTRMKMLLRSINLLLTSKLGQTSKKLVELSLRRSRGLEESISLIDKYSS